ncbi:MAG: DnaD domain protein [Clostridia bacterium]|nr:DnaD domain protein [Clostridia bacterium]
MAKIEIANPIVPIELNFINKYLPEANPTHVMVYIYALGLCYSNKQSDNASIAEALDILESDVIKAWKYWVKTGLIALGEDGTVTFLSTNVEERSEKAEVPDAPKEEPKAKAKGFAEETKKTSKRDIPMEEITEKMGIKKGFSDTLSMAQLIWEKPFTPTEIKMLYSFMDWYSFSSEVLTMIVEYCALEEKTKNIKYMEAVAESWANEGITTMKMAEKIINKKQKELSMLKKCAQIFSLGRAFSDKEANYISEWTNTFGMSEAMIKEAYARTTINTGKLSFQYMNKILSSWSKDGIKTLAALKEAEGSRKNAQKTQQQGTSSNYDFDEIERLALAKRLKKNQ